MIVGSYTTLKKRFTRSLRAFNPRPDDTLVLVTLENLQSLLLLELAISVEQEYSVVMHHLHLGGNPDAFHELAIHSSQVASSRSIDEGFTTYTDVKLAVASLSQDYPQALFLLPFTADDLACYFLGEVLRGNLAGLTLEATARVAYPLYSTSLQEIEEAYSSNHLKATLMTECKLLRELQGRVSAHAFGRFYVDTFVKARGF